MGEVDTGSYPWEFDLSGFLQWVDEIGVNDS